MNQTLISFIVIVSLMIGLPMAYMAMRLYRRIRWNCRLKKYRKTGNSQYLY